MKTAEQTQQLADWLAATVLGWLELRMPDGILRLGRDPASGRFVPMAEDLAAAPDAGPGTTANAASVGLFLDRHPLAELPLVRVGERVAAGQPVGLLQVGPLLLPVAAPQDGVVAAVVGPVGSAVGFGTPLVELQAL